MIYQPVYPQMNAMWLLIIIIATIAIAVRWTATTWYVAEVFQVDREHTRKNFNGMCGTIDASLATSRRCEIFTSDDI